MHLQTNIFLMDTTRQKIVEICREHGITQFMFNGDDSINVDTSLRLFNHDLVKIPTQINIVKKDFVVQSKRLENLENGPRVVCGSYVCSHNRITSLKGVATRIYGTFNCEDNNLTSLEHFPEQVDGWIYIKNNPFVEDDAFYTKILHILESEKYPRHDMDNPLSLLTTTDGFNSWLEAKRRIETIQAIINS